MSRAGGDSFVPDGSCRENGVLTVPVVVVWFTTVRVVKENDSGKPQGDAKQNRVVHPVVNPNFGLFRIGVGDGVVIKQFGKVLAEALMLENLHKGVRKQNRKMVNAYRKIRIMIKGVGDPGVVNHATVYVLCNVHACPNPNGVVKAAIVGKNRIIRYMHVCSMSMLWPMCGVTSIADTPRWHVHVQDRGIDICK